MKILTLNLCKIVKATGVEINWDIQTAGADVIETEGEVVEVLRNANFKVKLTNGFIITAYISGKLYMNNIKIKKASKLKMV